MAALWLLQHDLKVANAFVQVAYHVVFFDTSVNRSWIARDKIRQFSQREDPNQAVSALMWSSGIAWSG